MQDFCLAVITGMPILALIAVSLRFLTRHRRGSQYGWGK